VTLVTAAISKADFFPYWIKKIFYFENVVKLKMDRQNAQIENLYQI
jgi:hypothetical protein